MKTFTWYKPEEFKGYYATVKLVKLLERLNVFPRKTVSYGSVSIHWPNTPSEERSITFNCKKN